MSGNNLPNRKTRRLSSFDYSSAGTYFITMCSKNRSNMFGEVVAGKTCDGDSGTRRIEVDAPYERSSSLPVGRIDLDAPCAFEDMPYVKLSETGKIVESHIRQIESHYTDIIVDNHVVMPNHIHVLLSILVEDGRERARNSERIPRIIAVLKRLTNKAAGEDLWQPSYHDRIIRSNKEFDAFWNYIDTNPLRWELDKYYT